MRAEHPGLLPDYDPEIERYFDLRSAGRAAEALALYRSRLVPRYPDEFQRTELLRHFRLKNPLFRDGLAGAWEAEAQRLVERLRTTLLYIARRVERFDRSDAYATIRAAEDLLAILPRERFAAVSAMERLRRFADLLDYRPRELAYAEELVRAYVNESLEVVEAERRRREAARADTEERRRRDLVAADERNWEDRLMRRRAEDAERAAVAKAAGRRSASTPKPLFDLSRLRFSAQDLARMTIPPTLTRLEDKVLAFCFKYWPLADDASFERTVFLYSRKNGTKHYDVFRIVKMAKARDARDEELLSAVLSELSTGYYYSIGGDRYLQIGWRTLKARLEPKPGPASHAKLRKSRRRTGAHGDEGTPSKVTPATTVAPRSVPETEGVEATIAAPRPGPKGPRRSSTPTSNRDALSRRRRRAMDRERSSIRVRQDAAPDPQRATVQKPRPKGAGSVADRLRKLSGRSYDVYRDIFFTKVRPSIRAVLSKSKAPGKRGIFAAVPEEAEELVFTFLKEKYADPYMDWPASEERRRLRGLGFELEDLDGVIEDCYRKF